MKMNRQPKTRHGFTLVELLVVVLILAILMAVALPLYLNAITNSEKGTARANMQTIANAEQSAKLANTNHTYVTLTGGVADDNALPDLPQHIAGPGDRLYTVNVNATDTPVAPEAACVDGNGALMSGLTPPAMVPAQSFYVTTTSASGKGGAGKDGCFIPGVTPN